MHNPIRTAAGIAARSRRFLARPEETLGVGALALALLVIGAHAVLAQTIAAGGLAIETPWSRATPPGAKVAGGYLAVKNPGPAADRLTAATAEIAGRTEIHEMTVTDGVMRMRHLPDGVAVPAGAEVKLEPGSYHLMFMELKRGLAKGERVKGTLTFEKAGTVAVEFVVQGIGDTKPPAGGLHPGMPAPKAP